jgi:hypothetical protein
MTVPGLLAVALVGSLAFANEMADLPGMIPIAAERHSAADLQDKNGNPLDPDEADQLRSKGVDLSLLNPQNSTQWSSPALPQKMAPLDVQSTGEQFMSMEDQKGRVGIYRATVTKLNVNGSPRTYRIVFSKKSHNYLLRKALLRKLGYQTPDVKHLKKFSIKFKGAFSRNQFVKSLKWATGDDTERWVLNGIDADTDTVELQDAAIIDPEEHLYAFPDGVIVANRVKNRRVMQALVVPFTLLDMPESANVFEWEASRISNNNVYLPYEGDAIVGRLRVPFEDARWITRQIAKLSRADWQSIVNEAEYPPEVAALVLEKIISRRNIMNEHFKVDAPVLEFNPHISMPPNLVDGKLLKKDWEGYGSRFAFDDPAAPLSAVELQAFAKSRGFSTLLDNGMKQLSDFSKLDINKPIYDRQVKLAQERFINFLKTGKESKTPFGIYPVPTASGNLIVSRDVVTGAYMGTDNLVQLADTFGYQVNVGILGIMEGLPTPVQVSGQLGGSFVRTYTHIKPIVSIQAALKEPFKNVAVNVLERDFAGALEPAATADETKATTKEELENLQKAIDASVSEFKNQLKVGESLLIADNISGVAGINGGYNIAKAVTAHASLSDALVNVQRLQIFRKDENTIQFYQTPADYSVLSISAGIDFHIPIFSMTLGRKKGTAETSFYSLSIQTRDENDQPLDPAVVLPQLRALRDVLLTNKMDSLEALNKPFKLSHKFKETSFNPQFLQYRWLNLHTLDGLTAEMPNGDHKTLAYRSDAQVAGKSYEALALDVVESILKEAAGSDVQIASAGAGLPGQGIFGSSVSRRASFEAEVSDAKTGNPLNEVCSDITYQWKGWEISKDGLLAITKEITDRFGFKFYQPNALSTTTKIQFYNVQLQMKVYQEGINEIVNLDPKRFADALAAEKKTAKREQALATFTHAQEDYRKAQAKGAGGKGAAADMTKYAQRMLSVVESTVNAKKFIELLGGERNIFVKSSVNGFRVGDPRGDSALISNTIGEVGSLKSACPLRFIQNNLDMSESEFFIYWLLNKI